MSYPRSTMLLLLGVAALIALAGCGGSGGVMSQAGHEPTSQDVTAVMQRVVLPAIGGMRDFNPQSGSATGGELSSTWSAAPSTAHAPSTAAPPAGRSGRDNCATIEDDFCSSGSHAICNGSSSEPWTFVYHECQRQVGLIDGNWTIQLQNFSGTATFALSIDELALAGSVEYALVLDGGLCSQRTFDGLSATRPEWQSSIDGTVKVCLGSSSAQGHLDLLVVGPDTSFQLSLNFDDGTGQAVAVRDGTTLTCTIDMHDGIATDCLKS